MPDTIQPLKQLVELVDYVNTCPTASIRERLFAQEIAQIEKLHEEEHRYPEVEIRWLYFHLKKLEENTTKNVHYLSAAINCEHPITKFVKEHTEDVNDEIKLKLLIQQQKELIFNQCLFAALLHHLRQGQQEAEKNLSIENILADAKKYYRSQMYREALHQYETLSLIDRRYFLEQKKRMGEKDYVMNFMTIQTSTEPELRFLDDRLKQSDLHGFKLEETVSLKYSLEELTEFSEKEMSTLLDTFFREQGDSSIDSRVSDMRFATQAGNNIKMRTFNDYFNSPEQTLCMKHMIDSQSEIESFIHVITVPKSTPQPLETTDKSLLTLRTLVRNYQSALDEIEKTERATYENRSANSLNQRKLALNTLETSLNRVDKLTDETRHLAHLLVLEMKNNEPSWGELHWIDKLLDVITCGAHALYRNSIFKEPKPVNELYDNVESESESESDSKGSGLL
ncbi:MAG: hypothetical protein ACRCXC_01270 [Legionella sp.]